MSSATKHRKRSHRSEYRARAYTGGRLSVITPALHKQHSFNLMRMIRGMRRKQPETREGRAEDGTNAAS